MDFKMAIRVTCYAVVIFYVLSGLFSMAFMALWYLCGVGMRWMRSQPSPWHNPNPDWCNLPCALALLAAAVLVIVMLFAPPTEVHRNPRMRGVRVEFREPSAWRDLTQDHWGSDCYTLVTISHIASNGRRTSTDINDYTSEWRGSPDGEPDRTVQWATNGSDRAVITTSFGETFFLPDLLPLPADVPESAIRAYLDGQPTDVVLRLLQTEGRSNSVP